MGASNSHLLTIRKKEIAPNGSEVTALSAKKKLGPCHAINYFWTFQLTYWIKCFLLNQFKLGFLLLTRENILVCLGFFFLTNKKNQYHEVWYCKYETEAKMWNWLKKGGRVKFNEHPPWSMMPLTEMGQTRIRASWGNDWGGRGWGG